MWTLLGIIIAISVLLAPYWHFLFCFFTDQGDDYIDLEYGDDWVGVWAWIILIVFMIIGIVFVVDGIVKNNVNVLLGIVELVFFGFQSICWFSGVSYQDLKKEFMRAVIRYNEKQKGEK